MKGKYILTITALALLTGLGFAARLPKPALAPPTISCAAGSTGSSIDITVTAGANGAPAGFSIQWITLDEYTALGGWPDSSDVPNPTAPSFCKASFSGNATGHVYNLGAGQSVTVTIGDTIYDTPGASSPCGENPLLCGTIYVFRAFAHANSSYDRSAFTANLQCSTLPCAGGGGCTYTQGYWKTHPDTVENPWPVSTLVLGNGSRIYDSDELLSIFETPAAGNGLIQLAHQLIAAKLNIANGADGSSIAATITDADALIGSLIIPPFGTGYLAPSATAADVAALTSFNEGAIGPGHCQ